MTTTSKNCLRDEGSGIRMISAHWPHSSAFLRRPGGERGAVGAGGSEAGHAGSARGAGTRVSGRGAAGGGAPQDATRHRGATHPIQVRHSLLRHGYQGVSCRAGTGLNVWSDAPAKHSPHPANPTRRAHAVAAHTWRRAGGS